MPLHDDREVIANLWIRPTDALARHRAGEFEMIFPTIRSLEALERFASADDLLAAAAAIGDVPTILPRIVADQGGVRIVLPGDPGYDDLVPAVLPTACRLTELDRHQVRAGGSLMAASQSRPRCRRPRRRTRRHRPEPLVPGVARRSSPLVRRIVAPNPGMMTGPGTNTYLVGIDEIAVIDPGPDDAEHLDAIAGCGGDRIRWIVCTHTHPDHSPGAAGLKERTGRRGPGLRLARRARGRHHASATATRIEATEFRLRAVHTPGHASNHLCYLLEEERAALLRRPHHGGLHRRHQPARRRHGRSTSTRWPRCGPSALKAIAPGHGSAHRGPEGAIDDYIEHRLAREQQILDAGHRVRHHQDRRPGRGHLRRHHPASCIRWPARPCTPT